MIMTAGRMLADERLAVAIAQVEDLVFAAIDVDRHIAADDRGMLGHCWLLEGVHTGEMKAGSGHRPGQTGTPTLRKSSN